MNWQKTEEPEFSEDDWQKHIGENIRLARTQDGKFMSQIALAKRLGTTEKAIIQYEKGERKLPASKIPLLAKILDISIEQLFDGTDLSLKESIRQKNLELLKYPDILEIVDTIEFHMDDNLSFQIYFCTLLTEYVYIKLLWKYPDVEHSYDQLAWKLNKELTEIIKELIPHHIHFALDSHEPSSNSRYFCDIERYPYDLRTWNSDYLTPKLYYIGQILSARSPSSESALTFVSIDTLIDMLKRLPPSLRECVLEYSRLVHKEYKEYYLEVTEQEHGEFVRQVEAGTLNAADYEDDKDDYEWELLGLEGRNQSFKRWRDYSYIERFIPIWQDLSSETLLKIQEFDHQKALRERFLIWFNQTVDRKKLYETWLSEKDNLSFITSERQDNIDKHNEQTRKAYIEHLDKFKKRLDALIP